ncbi:tetratricopeptide repeat protein, partial [Streptomyces sp. NPDC052127]
MDVMGDKATLFETGRFVQPSGEEATPDESRDETADAVETGEAVEEMSLRLAAQAGDVEAVSVLGAMLLRRGDLDGAEPHLRAATAEGDRAAANNLGVLLHQRGYPDEAAGWWRVAAVAGSA